MNTASLRPTSSRPDEAQGASILDVLTVLSRQRLLLAFAPILSAAVALGATFLLTPQFTSATQLMPPQQQQGGAAALLGSLGGLVGGAATGLKNPSEQWVGLLKSRTIADALIKRFDLCTRYEVEYQFQARNDLEARTRITVGKDSLIDIEVEDANPQTAADLANAYVEELQNLTKSIAIGEAAQRRAFFETQLQEVKNQLTKAEINLRASGINASVIKANPEAAIEGVARLKALVTEAEVRLSVLQIGRTPANPELQQAQREIVSLKAQLQRAEQSEVGPKSTGDSGSAYISRYRDFKYYETLFELMARQYELARSDEAKEGSLIQVVDRALPAERKSSPKRLVIALIIYLAALATTVGYILSREAWRSARQ